MQKEIQKSSRFAYASLFSTSFTFLTHLLLLATNVKISAQAIYFYAKVNYANRVFVIMDRVEQKVYFKIAQSRGEQSRSIVRCRFDMDGACKDSLWLCLFLMATAVASLHSYQKFLEESSHNGD
jgi:hypothetical protein